MNKFQKLVADNGSATLKRRAALLSTNAQVAQETVVNTLKNEVTRLELKLDNLTDLAPESSESLRPGSKDWDPTKWASEVQRTKFDLWQANVQLNLANETLAEYFTDEEEPVKKSK